MELRDVEGRLDAIEEKLDRLLSVLELPQSRPKRGQGDPSVLQLQAEAAQAMEIYRTQGRGAFMQAMRERNDRERQKRRNRGKRNGADNS